MNANPRRTNGGNAAPERFTPLFNDAFLKIFGSADSAPVTQPLVNSILRAVGLPEIQEIEHIGADASLPGGVECKSPRLDVVVVSDDGRLFDLEAQRRKTDIGNKSVFYSAKLLVENTAKNSRSGYHDAPQVITMVLLKGSKLFPDESQFLTTCRFNWKLDSQYVDGPDCITLIVAELDKVRERYNEENIGEVLQDESLAWLYLLATGYKQPEEIDRMAESFPTMEEFAARYGIAIGDPDLKRAYDKYWESIMEYNTEMYIARKEATEEGHAEGLKQGLEQSIAQLRAAGFDEAADLLEKTKADGANA